MREYAVPEVVPDPGPNVTMADAVDRNAHDAPADVVFSVRDGAGWKPVTTTQFADRVHALARGLIASGIEAGDRVGLMSRTRYEWTLIDYAIWSAGAVTVPIYETSSAEQVEWILSDSGARALFVETPEHEATYKEVSKRATDVEHVWQIDGGGLDDLAAAGKDLPADALDKRREGRSRDDIATIVYTSGTTGRPKGCVLTHLNLLGTARSAAAVVPQMFNPDGSTLLFLPLAHVFGRLIQGACVENRVRMGHSADVKNLVADLGQFQPTFLLSVPRVFEKVFNTYQQQAEKAGKGKIFQRGVDVAVAWSEALQSGKKPGIALTLQHTFFERVLYSKALRAPLGGKIQYAISGGAPLGARLGHFFRGMGITILEGYGLTETSAAGSVNTVDHIEIGTVGRPSPGCTVRIADDGEILMKGRHIFKEYWHNEKATEETVGDGWFHSGDIGELDDNGFLKITGRKKELIVTAGGKNVAPAVLEDRLRGNPLVSQAVVVGDNRPFIAALVTIDPDSIGPWADAHGKGGSKVADLVDDADLKADVQKAVDEANKAVSHAEAIKKFTILPDDFSEDAGTLTPSMKVKRNVVHDRYADEIEALYAKR